jgi:hypothetical protein
MAKQSACPGRAGRMALLAFFCCRILRWSDLVGEKDRLY